MKYILLVIFSLFFIACSSKTPSIGKSTTILQLQKKIHLLSKKIKEEEAYDLAFTSYNYTLTLAEEYELISPPLLHNTLVNLDIKKRGLCYHFAEDLITKLKEKNYENIDLHFVVAKPYSYFEHSAVVITAKNQNFKEGILLDGWRNSGKLYFTSIKEDTDYVWIEDLKRSKSLGTIQ